MKRKLIIFTILALLIAALVMPANAATSGSCGENASWAFMDGTLSITGTGAVYDYDRGSYTPWYSLRDQIDAIYVDEGITGLGDYNFDGLSSAVTILLPSTLKTIGNYTFRDCKALDELELPNKLTTIGRSAFNHCDTLPRITIPASVTELGSLAFEYCGVLKEITFLGNAPTIGENAFRTNGSSLRVYYPGTNTTWTDSVKQKFGFSGSIDYVPVYKTVASGAVSKTINWELNDAGILTISGTGVMPDYDMTSQQPWFNKSTSIKSLVIQSGITQVGKYNFAFCENLENITFGDTVTMIGERAFYRLDSIKQLEIPDSVTTLDYGAFDSCKLLESVTFGKGVKNIGYYAFFDCIKLTQVTFNGDAPTVDSAFRTRSSSLTVYYPGTNATWTEEAKQNYGYEKTITWSPVYTIIASGECGENATWTLDDAGLLTISGSGVIEDNPEWRSDSLIHLIKSVQIADGITAIGRRAFASCNDLISITIPNSVISIGSSAFWWCTNLSDVYITDPVTWCKINYEEGDFSHSNPMYWGKRLHILNEEGKEVTEVVLDDTVTEIPYHAFNGSGITSITIPDNVTTIGGYAFSGCASLTDIILGVGIREIGDSAFYNCSNLANVYIYDANAWCNIEFTYEYSHPTLFADRLHILNENNEEVTELILDNTVTEIPDYAFNNSILTKVTIGGNVTAIGSSAFRYCNDLETIIFTADAPQFADNAFYGVTAAVKYPTDNDTWVPTVMQNYGGVITWNGVVDRGSCGNKVTWTLDEGGTLIISGTGAMANYYDLSSAPWYRNGENENIKRVIIEEGVTSVSKGAFYQCVNMESVSVPSTITAIGNGAFSGCAALTDIYIADLTAWLNATYDVSIPTFANKLPKNLYLKNELITDLVIPEGITTLPKWAFAYCASLKSVQIPGSVTQIGEGAFEYCSSLKSVELPDGMETLDDFTFNFCTALETVVLPDGLTKIGRSVFQHCYALKPMSIPDSVTVIDGFAFSNCKALDSIVLPDNLTLIGDYAFYHCEALKSIAIPDSVTEIQNSAFQECKALKDVYLPKLEKWLDSTVDFTGSPVGVSDMPQNIYFDGVLVTALVIPEGVTEIPMYFLSDCATLTSVQIPSSVTKIGISAFEGCTALKSVTIPQGVTDIEVFAFYKCSGLTEVTIPASVESLGGGAFGLCTGIKSIKFLGDAPETDVEYVTATVFEGVTATASFPENNTTWTQQRMDSYGGNLTWTAPAVAIAGGECGEDITWLLDNNGTLTLTGTGEMESYGYSYESYQYIDAPWYDYKDKIKRLIVSDGITTITNNAFEYCYNLISIELGADVSHLWVGTFSGCSSLVSVTIPESLHTINDDVFQGCSSLKHIHYTGTREQWNNMGVLENNDAIYNASVCFGNDVTVSQVESCSAVRLECSNCGCFYAETKQTASHNFVNGVCANCGVDAVWGYTIRKEGTVEITEYTGYNTDVVIPATIEGLPVTNIGTAFQSWGALRSVAIPNGVTEIGNSAFSNCSSLTTVYLPNALRSIGMYAFSGCNALTQIDLPDSLISIGSGAFSGSGLQSLNLSDNIESIGEFAFAYNEKLIHIKLPQGLSKIPNGLFSGCTGLTQLTLPQQVTSIGRSAFEGSGLQSVEIPGSVTQISDLAFALCESLEQIKFLGDPARIGSSAFQNVTATVYYPANNSNWNEGLMVDYGGDLTWKSYVPPYNGLVVVDGVWGYYEGGVLQVEYTGLVPYGDILFYVENGILDFTYTGLVWHNDAWRYVANSQLTEGYTGLVWFNDNWFYTVDSVIDWTFTGLVPYEGNYFYVQNNLLDWSYTGLGYHDGGWYFIQNGLLQKEYSGLVYFNDNWFYVEEGVLTYQYFGMVEYEGNLFYVQASHLDWNYTGLGYHEGAWYYFQNALYTPSFSGLVPFDGSLFYVKDGTIDWAYNGTAEYDGITYTVENGVAKQ